MSQPTRILVVEDDPAILQSISATLRARGYEVREARTAHQGLQLAREQPPEVAFLKVNLPDLSGLEVCRQLKADATGRDVFVVLVSGVGDPAAQEVESLGCGADDFLTRPVEAAEFLARIRTMLRRRSLTVALRTREQHYQQLIEILPEAQRYRESADITRQKLAEQSLRESEDRYRELAESLPDATFVLDRGAVIRYANRAAAEWLKLQPSQLLGRTPTELFPPATGRRYEEIVHRVLETGEAERGEEWFSLAVGRKWLEVRLVPLRGEEGRVKSVIGLARDLTRRKQIEEELRRLHDAVQSTDELISITDHENRFTFVNRAFLAAYGYTPEEVLGQTPALLQSRKNPPDQSALIFQATREGGWHGENLNRRKDGTEFPIFLSTACIRDEEGSNLGFVGVARDISALTRAEKQSAAFSQLGHRLSAADDAEAAATIILEIASELFGWDAGYVHLYSPGTDAIIPVLTLDTIGGRKSVVPPATLTLDPTPLMRKVAAEGACLINRGNDQSPVVPHVPFGDKARCSASLMHVPIRRGNETIGILSIQSYTPNTYSPADLDLLQTLADHCGEALHRINVTGALREAESRYRNIFENAVDGIFQTTPEGGFLSANTALAHLLGFDTHEELIRGVTDISHQLYLAPEKWEEFTTLMTTLGSVRGFEAELRRRDGSRCWVSLNARLVQGDGDNRHYEGTCRDITERKLAEQRQRTQRDFGVYLGSTNDLKAAAGRLLQVALGHEGVDCGAVYLVHSKTGALELMAHEGLSERMVERTSQSPGQTESSLPPPRRALVALLARFEPGDLPGLEVIPVQHGQQLVAALCVGSQLRGQVPPHSLRDIELIATQAAGAIARIHAEQLLLANQQNLERTLHSLRSPVLMVDADTLTLLDCNPAAIRTFGYTRPEMIGRTPGFLYLDEATFHQFQVQMREAVKQQGFLADYECQMRRKDGTVFPTEHSVTALNDELGRPRTWVNVVRNISRIKLAEAELRQVSQRIIEAQEGERLRVARELHDGVNQVIASANMRLRKVQDHAAALGPAAREILSRCNQLLVQALEENRRIAHDLRPTDLDQLGLPTACRNLFTEFQARAGLKIQARFAKLARRLSPVVELNLFRIVQEALTNVERHARANTVRVSLVGEGDQLVLKITDDGRGFVAGPPKRARRKPGGIGLTNMRERAAFLGGTCEVNSAPKQGTAIIVRVPGEFGGKTA